MQLLNRNPSKRLGSGGGDCEEIKQHAFFLVDNFSWEDVINKRTHLPQPYIKRVLVQDIPDDKVYGRGAFDENLKNLNRVNEWSYIQKPQPALGAAKKPTPGQPKRPVGRN